MTLVKFANGHKNHAVNPFFSDVFDSILNDSFLSDKLSSRVPAVNIAETENEFHIELAAPKKTENVEEGKKFSKREYSYNSFTRSFTLPESADAGKIEAEYVDGVLNLKVAKREEAKVQSREIAVK